MSEQPTPSGATPPIEIACAVVDIERIVAGGGGLARTATGVVLVDRAAPGDRLKARISRRAGVQRGEIEGIERPGPGRRSPPCPYYDDCGGCDFQHLTYAAQLVCKQQIVVETFRRVGRLQPPVPLPIAGAEFAYRRRFQLHSDDGRSWGFRSVRSRRVVAIDDCLVVGPGGVAAAVRHLSVVQPSADDSIGAKTPYRVPIVYLPGPPPRVVADVGTPCSEGRFRDELVPVQIADESFLFSPRCFLQANLQVFGEMVRWVDAVLEREHAMQPAGLAFDWYAGVGVFARLLSRRCARVVAVEQNPAAVVAGRANTNHERVQFVNSSLESWCERTTRSARTMPKPDVIVMDPPRVGLSAGVRRAVGRFAPRLVVYVSCDPATCARDLAALCAQGLRIVAVQPFDFFPQTAHVEVAVVLQPAEAKAHRNAPAPAPARGRL